MYLEILQFLDCVKLKYFTCPLNSRWYSSCTVLVLVLECVAKYFSFLFLSTPYAKYKVMPSTSLVC